MLHESGLGQGPLAARRGRGGPMASANIGNIRASRRRGAGQKVRSRTLPATLAL
jgi:hypothetical protein